MPTGGSQRYGAHDPYWYLEPDFQAQTGINPLRAWIDGLHHGEVTRDNGQMRNRAGNTPPLQSFVRTTGLGAVINHRDDINASAQQRTKQFWGAP